MIRPLPRPGSSGVEQWTENPRVGGSNPPPGTIFLELRMFKKINLTPENKTFSEIMGNAKSYAIPRFQRDFSWEDEQLSELWQDIEQMHANKTQHFMGYIVFQTKDNKFYEVIDGQQRLTTLNLYILAALACFQEKADKGDAKEENEQRIKNYRRIYIGFLDSVTLITKPKLTLNRNNGEHFQAIIRDLGVPQKRGVIATNRKLNRGFEFFKRKLDELNLSAKDLAKQIESVSDGLVFITISVADDLNAYLVFETLNARGMQLSAPDLLKNYLLSTVAQDDAYHKDHFDDFENRWVETLKQLGESNFTDFLRSHVGISSPLPYKKELYRDLKGTVTTSQQVFAYLKEIENNAPIYTALREAQDSFWNDYAKGNYGSKAQLYIRTLKHFNIKTPMSLLMSAFNTYRDNPKDFVKILQWITAISIRYNVIGGKVANDQETLYNRLANKLNAQPNLKPEDIKQELKPVYPNDAEFKNAFRNKQMPSRQTNKKIVFLLSQIENYLNNEIQPSSDMTLEHILPQKPKDEWQESFGRNNYDDAIDRLGNLTILTDKDNMGQQPFERKCEVLKESKLALNRKIAEYRTWDMDTLDDYQGWLANHAASVWKIDGL